jgi:SAM-dependent methyltransferase
VQQDGKLHASGPHDLVKGYYLGAAVYHLHRLGILALLSQPATAAEVSARLGLNADVLESLLHYLSSYSDILDSVPPGRYVVKETWQQYGDFGFHIDKFIGAYGPLFQNLDATLHRDQPDKTLVNHDLLSEALAAMPRDGVATVADIVSQWNAAALLDLGCGPGTLLEYLCASNPAFVGWGVDLSPAMCRRANEALKSSGFSSRATIVCGDCRELHTLLPEAELNRIQAVYGGSIMNEFFGNGNAEAISFLRYLRSILPGRFFFIADYYGKLGRSDCEAQASVHTYNQDLVQILSGQGVPPGNLRGWVSIYEGAECRPQHAYECDADGLQWFVHVVEL